MKTILITILSLLSINIFATDDNFDFAIGVNATKPVVLYATAAANCTNSEIDHYWNVGAVISFEMKTSETVSLLFNVGYNISKIHVMYEFFNPTMPETYFEDTIYFQSITIEPEMRFYSKEKAYIILGLSIKKYLNSAEEISWTPANGELVIGSGVKMKNKITLEVKLKLFGNSSLGTLDQRYINPSVSLLYNF